MEKMKKPDFLGEINKEILEELTKRGRARNVAGLVGEVKELAEVTQICGLPFAGYLGKIEIPRPSGIKDEVAVAFEQDAPYKAAQGELDVLQEFAPGSCFIPCICWQETADEVAGWEQGTKVRLLGRYQSREYDKEVATYYAGGKEAFRETERRTAYELSVQLIEKMEAGNEK